MPQRIRYAKASKEKGGRRDSLRAQACCILAGTLALLLLAGCAAFDHPPADTQASSGMALAKTPFLLANPWIEAEIRQFLAQPEVRDAFGFDPLSYENIFTVTLLEQRMSEQGIFRLFGTAANQDVYIQGRIFEDNASSRRHTGANGHDADAARRASMLDYLAADPQMLILYRNLLICHEVAHVVEWYALLQRQETIRYTGHGISDRIEIRILTNLLQTGKVRPEVYSELFLFYVTFLNQDAEPAADVARYYRQAVARFGAPTCAGDGGAKPGHQRSASACPR